MQKLRSIHRAVMLIIALFVIWISLTGIFMQAIDIKSWLTKAPGTDLNMVSLRESFNGPPNYEVIGASDYDAPALSSPTAIPAMLARSMPAVRAAAAGEALRYVEIRTADGKPVVIADAKPAGYVEAGGPPKPGEIKSHMISVDGLSGKLIGKKSVGMDPFVQPFRNTIKGLHRFGFLGFAATFVNVLSGLGLATLIVTGTLIYLKLLKARQRLKRNGLFWKGGDWWRALHRSISMVAAVFLTIIVVSGTYISFEGLYFQAGAEIYKHNHNGQFRWLMGEDQSKPLTDAELPGMAEAALHAQNAAASDQPLKVVRLRYYSGMPQGVTVSGVDNGTRQLVFDLRNGRSVSETEPEYPASFLPLGWQMHQWAKNVHRGDYLALPGRTVSGHVVHLLAGLAMLYLSISGLEMYLSAFKKRRANGRKQLFWR